MTLGFWTDRERSLRQKLLMASWIGAVFLGAIGLSGTFVAYFAQGIEAQYDFERVPPPGRLVSVGEHRLHANVQGQGWPTVVLDAGYGGSSLDWSLVAPAVAESTRVVSYDRAGMGWSDPGPEPRTSRRIAEELHTLLERLGIEPPYILVGHSFGGINVRTFFRLYPEEVAGIVLVDASHEAQLERFPSALNAMMEAQVEFMDRTAKLASFGVTRVLTSVSPERFIPEDFRSLPESARQALLMFYGRRDVFDAMVSEGANLERSMKELKAMRGPMGRLPLTVITAGRTIDSYALPPGTTAEEMRAIWMALQEELVGLSQDSKQVVVEDSGHYVNLQRPYVVVNEIREMIAKLKRKRRDRAAASRVTH